MTIVCLIVFVKVFIIISGQSWLQWSKWSAECEPKCWKGKGKQNKFPQKTRSRTSLNGITETETEECDWKICAPGRKFSSARITHKLIF